jgi:hypothetical protein
MGEAGQRSRYLTLVIGPEGYTGTGRDGLTQIKLSAPAAALASPWSAPW